MSGWEARAAVRRDALSKRIPPARQVAFPPAHELACVQDHPHISSLLTTHELEVTTAPTPEILRQLQRGTWTAEATVAAYCKRAALAQQALNYATDIFFDEAINTAREYDEYFRSNRGKVKGPLHGLPISIKDPFDEDALVVSILGYAGAIPFIKTNTSQACLLAESTNNIYGTTLNPWNQSLSAGGSFGGEGALVAFRCSPLGLGTDGGGSLRIPAVWNGLYTLKPTVARIPGFPNVVLAAKPWISNPAVVPIPWNTSITAPAKLKLGFLLDDGITHFSPPVLRSLHEAASTIRQAGHEIIDLSDPQWRTMHREAATIAFKMYTQEGGTGLRAELDKTGEPLVPRACTGWSETPLTPTEIWLNHRARRNLRKKYQDAYLQLGLDAIITAPMPHPAPPHGEYNTSAICAVYNALDTPVCVVPFGVVDLEKDRASEEWYAQEAYPEIPNFPYNRCDADLKKLYTGPELFGNVPLGLQIVACSTRRNTACSE